MSETMKVIAQCQRCGRGFISLKVDRDPYAHPEAYRRGDCRPCGGAIGYLAKPLPIEQFANYGPILETT